MLIKIKCITLSNNQQFCPTFCHFLIYHSNKTKKKHSTQTIGYLLIKQALPQYNIVLYVLCHRRSCQHCINMTIMSSISGIIKYVTPLAYQHNESNQRQYWTSIFNACRGNHVTFVMYHHRATLTLMSPRYVWSTEYCNTWFWHDFLPFDSDQWRQSNIIQHIKICTDNAPD